MTPREMVDLGLLAVSGVGMITFVVLYALRSNWRATAPGRYLMHFMVIASLFTAYVVIEEITFNVRSRAPYYVAQLVLEVGLVIAIWQLVYVLVRTQRRERRERSEDDERND